MPTKEEKTKVKEAREAKAKVEKDGTARLPKVTIPPSKVEEKKIDDKELLSLQEEGKLVSYDPETKIGTVREKGIPTRWPAGRPFV